MMYLILTVVVAYIAVSAFGLACVLSVFSEHDNNW
jgi:hypothetical protein